ncbi:MAG: zinc-binding dehydrogenase [Phycisphaera sp.]|nr:zinc-binding dehydrogenase [Phycisphaera sp.]
MSELSRVVVVDAFGGVENLQIVSQPLPDPAAGQVRVRVTGIGMNHADLMARRGEYKISSGEPPFTPGLEAGGVIDAVGQGVERSRIGQRVTLGVDATRRATGGGSNSGGTYRTHYLVEQSQAIPVPDAVPDDQLGALWLPYLTAWTALVWKGPIKGGQIVALPAASSSVALAAAQIVKRLGGIAVGLTTSQSKADRIQRLATSRYDHLVVTHDAQRNMLPWHRDIKRITDGRGVDVFFDPVASGAYLNTEILCLAQHGRIFVYGLLGEVGPVDVTPLIRKHASVTGLALGELAAAGPGEFTRGYHDILSGFESGAYMQHVDRIFELDDVREAHAYMEKGSHVGKLVLVP